MIMITEPNQLKGKLGSPHRHTHSYTQTSPPPWPEQTTDQGRVVLPQSPRKCVEI